MSPTATRSHVHSYPHPPSLRRPSLGYSPYPSDISAASPESPLSSSSANESPLPEPPIDSMDNDMAAHVATGNDDYYPYTISEDISLGYPYTHIGSRPLPLPAYTPEYYKQPVSAPLPLNISVAMGYSWSPEAKKFQPLYPPIQQIQRQEHSPPKYPAQPPVAVLAHPAARATCSTQPFDQPIDEPDLVYPQLPSRNYASAPTQLTQPFSPGYTPRQGVSVKQESNIPFPDLYNRSADIAGPSSGFGAFRPLLDSGPHVFISARRTLTLTAPTDSSAALDLALQYNQSPGNHASMNVPVLSAPVPRHSAYFATSLVDNCERTCQEQEQEQERHALRVRTQGLQEQRTVRPAEVSPVMGVAELPDGDDEDAEGEPDVEPLSLHHGSTTNGHNTAGVYDYMGRFVGGSLSGTGSGEEAEEAEKFNGRDLDYDYRAEEEEDAGDGDFVPRSRTTSKNMRSLRPRSIAGRNPVRYHPYGTDVSPSAVKGSPRSPPISASDMSPASLSGHPGKMRKNARTLPIPVPVPNLTKKSRGRRVPTVSGTSVGRSQRDAALGARIYFCDVSGCGKCFARGEHLKRHIRSIHTYEKRASCTHSYVTFC